ncbi:MAG: DNA-binding domain-containing protein [Candidatus Gastranaerophilales bacterium]
MQTSTNETWISIDKFCALTDVKKETVRRKCKNENYVVKFEKQGRNKIYYILFSSVELELQSKITASNNQLDNKAQQNINTYSDAPSWAKEQVDKYLGLFNSIENLSYNETLDFIQKWNEKNPDKKTSYPAIKQRYKKYKSGGTQALLPKYGHKNNYAVIEQNYYDYFKTLYLKDGAPSAQSSWRITLGYAQSTNNDFDFATFPSCLTFVRRLKKEIPEQAIYLARYGEASWNKKYASYIPRNYSNISAGSFWVSDHAQIDVGVVFNGKTCFPWVTVFRDVKTSKWLGWFLHAEAPNSDHIFQAFYYGALRFGKPNDIYIDNGKDYRSKDFAGGRRKPCVESSLACESTRQTDEPIDSDVRVFEKNSTGAKRRSIKVGHNKTRENSLMANLGINVHFALPYNAQAKPVERDFLKIKSYLSKHMVGYRGGNVVERPEKLKQEIKENKIMQFDEFKTLFDDFILNVLNKMPSKGKILQGKCPDELWAEEFVVKNVLNKDALKLFCTRTSNDVKIGRNGVYDSSLKITYWSEWMIAHKGRCVYLRRDVNAYQEAWVFDAATDKYIDKANVYQAVSFMATTNVEKSEYKKAIEKKNREKKVLKTYLEAKHNPTNAEIIENYKRSLKGVEFKSNPKISKISNTKMDQVIRLERKSKTKPQKYVTSLEKKPKLYLTESEKMRATKQCAN